MNIISRKSTPKYYSKNGVRYLRGISSTVYCRAAIFEYNIYKNTSMKSSSLKQKDAYMQRRNHGWKVEGDQGLGPAPRPAKGRAGCWVREGGYPPPATTVRGYHSRKIFENSDAKSCILVTCCDISCFLKTTVKKFGGPIHCWFPNLKVEGPVSPGPYDCYAYAYLHSDDPDKVIFHENIAIGHGKASIVLPCQCTCHYPSHHSWIWNVSTLRCLKTIP